MFNTAICCSDTSALPTGYIYIYILIKNLDVCGGENPLRRPNPCAASSPCPAGFSCRNERCCPSKGFEYFFKNIIYIF